jgi:hypothetical protein
MNQAVNDLHAYLENVAPGQIRQPSGLDELLAQAWPSLCVGDTRGMEPYKLFGRMEEIEWHPPKLSFVIERHGGTVQGSSRAELQKWSIDTSTWRATCVPHGYRQLCPMSPRLDVRPLVAEIAGIICGGGDDSRVKWIGVSRNEVRVQIAAIIPDEGPAQTVAGRRKRFRKRLEETLAEHRWQSPRPNVFVRKSR